MMALDSGDFEDRVISILHSYRYTLWYLSLIATAILIIRLFGWE